MKVVCSRAVRALLASIVAGVLACSCVAVAQDQKAVKRRAKAAIADRYGNYFRAWLDEDARYIITEWEREEFLALSNDHERTMFIEQFWSRRDPTPDTYENEFKNEHYRRLVFANDRFSCNVDGWKTDRGRLYVMYGPPDEIVKNPANSAAKSFASEVWRYRYIEDIGQEVTFTFVDRHGGGDYKLESPILECWPNSALTDLRSPASGACMQKGLSCGFRLPANHRPSARFKDLEQILVGGQKLDVLDYAVRTDFVKATQATTLAIISIEGRVPNETWTEAKQGEELRVNMYGRVVGLSDGRVYHVFEDARMDTKRDGESVGRNLRYRQVIPLPPGRYQLDIAAKDVRGHKAGVLKRGLAVPSYAESRLSTTPIVLASEAESR